MRDYNYRKNWNDLLTPEIVKKLTLIHEYKGEQRLFIEAHKDELKELVEIAKVQSTEASNKIEGISTADDRLKNLVQAKTTPRNRDESEIAGYRDVLNTIHENYDYIPINANYILQLHRDLYKFLGNIDGGIFKTSDNIIREMDAEGNEKIRFRPVAAWETPASIDELCKAYNEAKGEADSLLLTMMFILDFLCIHPFNDGNGRMSRLLTLLLLYQSGFIVGKYISIEKIIEGSKETYYEVLQDSSINWHENENDYNHMFHGYDMDRTMLRIGAMNMMTHGIENPFIEYRDSLSDQNQDKGKYSLILANPPFKGSLDAESVSGDLLKVCKTKKTELLFLALFVRMLKVGGRCACIVPDGVLFGSSKAHKDIRKEIVENQRLEAVISMPSGVFKPYAGVSTAILIFTKTEHGGTDNVWFYDMTADGFSLDDKRSPIAENDIPDIIERFKNLDKEIDRKRTDKSFMVPKQDIVENGYDLSINKYKEIEYVPVEYPSTIEIMTNIREIEMEIGKEMEELEKLLDL